MISGSETTPTETIKAHLRCIADFRSIVREIADELGPCEIREYLLYMVKQQRCSWAVFNQTVRAPRFNPLLDAVLIWTAALTFSVPVKIACTLYEPQECQ